MDRSIHTYIHVDIYMWKVPRSISLVLSNVCECSWDTVCFHVSSVFSAVEVWAIYYCIAHPCCWKDGGKL